MQEEEKQAETMSNEIWTVNTSMIKTLENKRAELNRLESECYPEISARKKLVYQKEGSKKKAGRPKK